MKKFRKKTTFYDPVTGKVLYDEEKTIPSYFDDEKGYLFWPRKKQVRMFSDIPLPDGLTDSELGKLVRLSRHIWSDTNMLAYRGNGGLRPLGINKIAEILKVQERQARQFMNKMQQLGIIIIGEYKFRNCKESMYYFNPLYFCSSKWLGLDLYIRFRKDLNKYLPEWVIEKFSIEDLVKRGELEVFTEDTSEEEKED